MRVRLTVKLAEMVNGVDLSRHREGDILDLSDRDAAMMIAGGWAELVGDPDRVLLAGNRPSSQRPIR